MFLRRLLDMFAGLPRPARLAIYALAVAVVLYLCLAPTADVPGSGLIWDKAEHAITWAILAGSGYVLAPRRLRAVTVFAIGLGAAIELAQATMGFGRDGDWRDLAADTVGVAVALGLYLLIRRLLGR
jgi:VanZ family protein